MCRYLYIIPLKIRDFLVNFSKRRGRFRTFEKRVTGLSDHSVCCHNSKIMNKKKIGHRPFTDRVRKEKLTTD